MPTIQLQKVQHHEDCHPTNACNGWRTGDVCLLQCQKGMEERKIKIANTSGTQQAYPHWMTLMENPVGFK